MNSIAVLGGENFTTGFELAGVDRTYATSEKSEKVERILEEGRHGILVIEGREFEELPERLKVRAESSANPVVVPVSENAVSERLDRKIQQAIGVDITK